jgi:hypothetical protein
MAIFLPGIAISAARNKAGNIVFLDGAGGPTFRERVIPTNPQSTRQQAVRGGVTTLSGQWRTLTDAQRTAWNAYGDTVTKVNQLGTPYSPSGINAYVGANTERAAQGLALISAAPTGSGISAGVLIPAGDVETEDGTTTLNISNLGNWTGFSNNVTGDRLFFYMSPVVSPGVNTYYGSHVFVGVVTGDSTTPPTSAAFTIPTGPPTQGDRFNVIVAHYDETGRLPSEQRIDILTIA